MCTFWYATRDIYNVYVYYTCFFTVFCQENSAREKLLSGKFQVFVPLIRNITPARHYSSQQVDSSLSVLTVRFSKGLTPWGMSISVRSELLWTLFHRHRPNQAWSWKLPWLPRNVTTQRKVQSPKHSFWRSRKITLKSCSKSCLPKCSSWMKWSWRLQKKSQGNSWKTSTKRWLLSVLMAS